MSRETDPLLPNDPPAPEIHYHNHNHYHISPEVQYGRPAPISSTVTPESTPTYYGTNIYSSDQPPAYNDNVVQKPPQSSDNRFASVLKTGIIFLFICVVVGVVTLNDWPERNSSPGTPRPWDPLPGASLDERVFSILHSTPLIDGHNDLAIFIRGGYKNNITSQEFRSFFEHSNSSSLNATNDAVLRHGQVSLPRFYAGQAGGAFMSAFVLCPPNSATNLTDANYAIAVSHTLEQLDLLIRLRNQYPSHFLDPTLPISELLNLWHETPSRPLIAPLSIEGLHQLPPSAPFSALRTYYTLGVRMATLTWNCHNAFADASLLTDPENFSGTPAVVQSPYRKEGALTLRGQAVIREMNRLGMLVDLSHTSYWTQLAVLNGSTKHDPPIIGSRAPVVYSHSSAWEVCPHPRNVRNDILELVKQKAGVVMVNFSPDFISCSSSNSTIDHWRDPGKQDGIPEYQSENNTIAQVAKHVLFIGGKIGWDYVGIGSDFDGMGRAPRGLEGVEKFPALVKMLFEAGVGDEDVKKVVGGNIIRVWRAVERVAEQMIEEGVEPGVDDASGY